METIAARLLSSIRANPGRTLQWHCHTAALPSDRAELALKQLYAGVFAVRERGVIYPTTTPTAQ